MSDYRITLPDEDDAVYRWFDCMPALRDAAEDNPNTTVTDDGAITLAEGATKATIETDGLL